MSLRTSTPVVLSIPPNHYESRRRISPWEKVAFREILPIFAVKTDHTVSYKSNLATISKETGYSVTTVSRVLTGQAERYRISKGAVELITETALRCNYHPNIVAQSLRTQKSQTVGLLVPGIDNPFFAMLSGIIINLLAERGYHTLLADSRESQADEEQALRMFSGRKVDGIISIPASTSAALHEQIDRDIPVVLIDRSFDKTTLPYICTDNYAGARMASEFLLERGYRNILAIQGIHAAMPNRERLRGFKDAMEGSGADYAVAGDAFSVENGKREGLAAFSKPGCRHDAIFAFSSNILLGAIDAMRSLGLKAGRNVGVISFDNNGFLDFLDPAVTRIEQPLQEAAESVVETLFDIISRRRDGRPGGDPPQRLLRPTLVIRASC